MAVKKDYYKILNVAPRASFDEIKKSYRTLSKKYHPDLNPDLKLYSDEKMKELVEAYSVLSNREKRKEYENQAHYQVRRSRRGQDNSKSTFSSRETMAFNKKPTYQKSPSLMERILSPFLKKDAKLEKTCVDTRQADMHFTLGLSMAENESFYEQAVEEFRLAIKFDPKLDEALYNLALMYYKTGQFEEAVVNFQKVIAIKKEDPQARKLIQLLSDF